MILGVVCEYNPFHRGHLFQLAESRRAAGEESTVVCVLSGDFVQRGEAAVYSKFARAEAACRCGADLVLELPLPWSLASAEGFARGAVGLLGAIGVQRLCFGSETGDTAEIERLAKLLREEEFLAAVKARLKADAALSFAAARQREAEQRLGETARLLTQPNNILAVEYAKAIRELEWNMTLHAVRRQGSGHDQPGDGAGYPSASELRRRLAEGGTIDAELPAEAAAVFCREREQGRERQDPSALELPMLARLRALGEADFLTLPDADGGLGQRLYRAVREEPTLEEICRAAGTKRYAQARVRRLLLCACLGVRAGMAEGVPPYARVLAANAKGRALLRERATAGEMPLLTKPAAVRELPENCRTLFELGARAHDFYVLGYPCARERRPGADWRASPAML